MIETCCACVYNRLATWFSYVWEISICIMTHINTILRVLFQKGLVLLQLRLHSVFEQAAKTVMAWYKIVVPYKSVSVLSLHFTFCKTCSSMYKNFDTKYVVLVSVLKCVCFTADTVDCWLNLDFLWKLLALYIRLCFSIIVPHFHGCYKCFMYSLSRGLYSLI